MRTSLKFILLLLCVFLTCSCSSKKGGSSYQIGIDPSWYPLEVEGQEKKILAFSIELLSEIAKKERLQLSIVTMNWNNLVQGLNMEKYSAILSPMPTYNYYLKSYSFSDPYLKTGPVLIVPAASSIQGPKDLKDKEVGVLRDTNGELLLQNAPGVILRTYDSIQEALTDLSDKDIEAVILEILIAQNYIRNFYNGVLKIATLPLNEDGLRLITLHNKAPKLLKGFNHGLVKLKASGEYDKLLKKWGLSPDSKAVAELEQQIETFLESSIF